MNEQEQYEAIKFINRQERLIKSIGSFRVTA